MLLLDSAVTLLQAGWSVDEVRAELRAVVLGEDNPTCGYVEEVIQRALKILHSEG
jgi:hypothetical protein